MKKTEEIEAELINAIETGEPIEAIQQKHRTAKGSYYIALGRATARATSKLEGIGTELRNLNAKAAQGRETLKDLGRGTKAEERRNAEIHKANQDASHILGETRRQLEAKRKLLAKFREMGLRPTEGLELLGKAKNLKLMVASLNETAETKARELTTLEQNIPGMREHFESWKHRRDEEMARVAEFARLLNVHRVELNQLSQQIAQASAYLGELKRETTCTEDTRDKLVDETRKLRQRKPKLIFVVEGLDIEIVEKRTEIARLTQTSETLLINIISASEKITQVLNAEGARERRVDKEFARKTIMLKKAYDELIQRGDDEAEKEIKRRVGNRLEKLPIELERCADVQVQLVALGVQRGAMIDELKELDGKRREYEKSIAIPGIVVMA